MGVQICPCEGAILRGKTLSAWQMTAERARSTVLLQRNPYFGKIPDQVHFSCRKLCWKVTKHDVRILWLIVLVYELFECPLYTTCSVDIFQVNLVTALQTCHRRVWQIYCRQDKSHKIQVHNVNTDTYSVGVWHSSVKLFTISSSVSSNLLKLIPRYRFKYFTRTRMRAS